MASGVTHIIGAGLAGLAAAVTLSARGHAVVVHELARHPGGRCRSYFEDALGLTIDNGNHLILSGNTTAIGFIDTIGSRDRLEWPAAAAFPFFDIASGERWVLRPNAGRVPWWMLSPARRVPGSRFGDYLGLGRLLMAGGTRTIADIIPFETALYRRLMQPVLLAALNTDPSEASAKLAGAVIRETLAKGGDACRPLFASHGLGPVLIDPAVAYIERHGGIMHFDNALRSLTFGETGVSSLVFTDQTLQIGPDDHVILAVPAWVARTLVPDLVTPTSYRAILNAHFKVARPPAAPRILGVINGTIEWVFAFDDRLSVTISAADRFNEAEREPLARKLWAEVAIATGLSAELPPWQIVKERRATFAATPAEHSRRPPAETRWRNLVLAGDWTRSTLPATIEGAIRSGERAAALVSRAVP